MNLFFHTVVMLTIHYHFVQGSYSMSTVAGSGSRTSSGNGGPPTSAGISQLKGIWVDSAGNLFIPDTSNIQLRKVNATGIINVFIGSGTFSSTGNGGSALSVALDGVSCPYGDTAGNIYFSSSYMFVWFYHHTSGQVSRFAGTAPGHPGYSGDGGPATLAQLSRPTGLFLSTNGILYVADTDNGVIRAIHIKTNIITTIAGANTATALGDGGRATSAMMRPYGVFENTAGVLYIGDYANSRIRKVATDGIITTIVGTGNSLYNGDNIAATKANLGFTYNCVEDSLGNLYFSDFSSFRVRMVSVSTGNITTIAGNGRFSSGNGSLHAATAVNMIPTMLQIDSIGNIYFGDNRGYVRKLFTPTAVPTTSTTVVPFIVASKVPSAVPSVSPSPFDPSFRPSVVNVTVDSSSKSQRLRDLHIFYATFSPAIFEGIQYLDTFSEAQ